MTVSGPVSDGRAATNNTEHRYQLRGLALPRSATRQSWGIDAISARTEQLAGEAMAAFPLAYRT